MKSVKTSIAFLVLLILASCQQAEEVLVIKKTSPDNRVDATIVTNSMNATTSTSYRLYITSHDQPTTEENLVLLGDKFKELTLNWRHDKFLDVKYTQGRIFKYTNFWSSRAVDNHDYLVEIRLNPPVENFSIAP